MTSLAFVDSFSKERTVQIHDVAGILSAIMPRPWDYRPPLMKPAIFHYMRSSFLT